MYGPPPVRILFQSTHPARDATDRRHVVIRLAPDFNPRIPRGMRQPPCRPVLPSVLFQSTHPARDATVHVRLIERTLFISIHASREGCDISSGRTASRAKNFNPRIPRGMRLSPSFRPPVRFRFQSTHPARDATAPSIRELANAIFQSTHPARDATRNIFEYRPFGKFQSTHPARDATTASKQTINLLEISIHASREGCDMPEGYKVIKRMISIHASREGCDLMAHRRVRVVNDFNPRIPRGMRLATRDRSQDRDRFQSTHPARDATRFVEILG
ncbi:hypothetical protein B0G52_1382 [Cohnella sp. SGD-V74]|nr:hypothetical protein B0G52_1382 [Cohnella sp. SGD-V74]